MNPQTEMQPSWVQKDALLANKWRLYVPQTGTQPSAKQRHAEQSMEMYQSAPVPSSETQGVQDGNQEIPARHDHLRTCPAMTAPSVPPPTELYAEAEGYPLVGWPERSVLFPNGAPHLRPERPLIRPRWDVTQRQHMITATLKAVDATTVFA